MPGSFKRVDRGRWRAASLIATYVYRCFPVDGCHRRDERKASAQSALAFARQTELNRERQISASERAFQCLLPFLPFLPLNNHDLLHSGDIRGQRRRHHRHAAADLLEPRRESRSVRSMRSVQPASSTRCDSVSRFITDTELAVGSAPS